MGLWSKNNPDESQTATMEDEDQRRQREERERELSAGESTGDEDQHVADAPKVDQPAERQLPPGQHAERPWDPTQPGQEKHGDWRPNSRTSTPGEIVDSRERAAMPLGAPNTVGRNPNVHSEIPRDFPKQGEHTGVADLPLDRAISGKGAPSAAKENQSDADRDAQKRADEQKTKGDEDVERHAERKENISENERQQEREGKGTGGG